MRNARDRHEKKGELLNEKVQNEMYKTIFNEQLKRCLSGAWFPDCWFIFLAFGAASTNPAVSLWTPRLPRGSAKRKQPINESQQHLIKPTNVTSSYATSSSNGTSSLSSGNKENKD